MPSQHYSAADLDRPGEEIEITLRLTMDAPLVWPRERQEAAAAAVLRMICGAPRDGDAALAAAMAPTTFAITGFRAESEIYAAQPT